jgi:hypothetical protein
MELRFLTFWVMDCGGLMRFSSRLLLMMIGHQELIEEMN